MYSRALKVLKKYNGETLHMNKLRLLIARELASDPSKITKYLRLFGSHDFITEIEHLYFKIEVPEWNLQRNSQ